MQSLSVLLRQHAGDNNNRNLAAAQANLCVLVTVCRLALVPPWHFNSPVCVLCVVTHTICTQLHPSRLRELPTMLAAINIPNDNNDRDHIQTWYNRCDTTFPFREVGQASCPIHKHSHMLHGVRGEKKACVPWRWWLRLGPGLGLYSPGRPYDWAITSADEQPTWCWRSR